MDYVSCSFNTLAIVMVAESCDLQELLSYKLPLESMGRGETMRSVIIIAAHIALFVLLVLAGRHASNNVSTSFQ